MVDAQPSPSNKISYREHAAGYRALAEEARRLASGTEAGDVRDALLDIASDYDHLAVKMDRMAETFDASTKRRS
jgi:hypothetical protein